MWKLQRMDKMDNQSVLAFVNQTEYQGLTSNSLRISSLFTIIISRTI